MDSAAPQPSGDKSSRFPGVPALLLFLFAIGVPGAAAVAFAQTITQNPWQWLAFGLLYEFCIGLLGFLGKVWQRLEGLLVDRTTSWIEMQASMLFSRSWRRYRGFLIHEHEVFDIKGLTTHPGRDLELEQVFVQLDVDPTPAHQALVNPIPVPEALREGSHHIWSYLADKTLRSRHFVIVGAPGSGKTTLLKHLALCLAKHREAGVQRIPAFLYLRDYTTTLKEKYDPSTDTFAYSLAEAVNTHIQRKWQQSFPLAWIKRKLTKGQCLVLLDGLDEVADDHLRKLVVKWVQSQMLAYGGNRFLLTSRPYGYRDNPLEGVWVLETRSFTSVQVAQFVRNWYRANEYKSWGKKDAGMQMRAREGADDLLSRLYRAPALLAFAVNPLLLTMIATVHRYRGELPGSRVALYGEICDVFLGKRRKAIGLAQELTPAQILRVLRPLAYSFMQQGKREMKVEEACQIIAPHLLRVSTGIQPDEFLCMVQNTSGLLLERNPGLYGFAHKTFQEYLTAAYITKEERLEQELIARVQDDWWHETIRLYCAQADATAIVKACLANDPSSAQALALALDCVEEKLTIEPAVKEQIDTLLEKGREDPESERRRVIAEALLRRRLDQMVHLHDEVFVDTSFVTCAEYQLFLDERQTQGNYHQPDHWSTPTFPQGQGHLALVGMRPADVRAFCQWLSERDAGAWHYRMPTMSEHQQIEEKLQGTCKLDAGRGYWVNEGQVFVWVGSRLDYQDGLMEAVKGLHGQDVERFAEYPTGRFHLDMTQAREGIRRLREGDASLREQLATSWMSSSSYMGYGAYSYSSYSPSEDQRLERTYDFDAVIDRLGKNYDRRDFRPLDHAFDNALQRNVVLNFDDVFARVSAVNLQEELGLQTDLVQEVGLAEVFKSSASPNFMRMQTPPLREEIEYLGCYVRTLIGVAVTHLSYWQRSTAKNSPSPFSKREVERIEKATQHIIATYLDLYVALVILEERYRGKLSACEGILFVKESREQKELGQK